MSKTTNTLLELLGTAVLLDVTKGGKAPRDKRWQRITLEDMTPHYLRGLTGNIGVSLGKASNGLHSIDCDEETTFARLLELNPDFANTLQSHGKRGGNFWLRIEGEAPKTGHFHRRPKSKDSRLGEWRGTGAQTIIHGRHPSGINYRNNGRPVATMKFSDIVWPSDWWMPWQEHDAPPASSKEAQAERQSKDRLVVETMLQSIPPRPDYDLWMKLVAAVRNSLGNDDEAVEMLKAWSPEETPGEYSKLLKSSAFPEITFGTLFHHADDNGFAGAVKRFFYSTRAFGMQGRNGYIPLNGEAAVRQHLEKLGVPKPAHGSILCDIRETQFVDYIGPIAGHPPGLHTFNGSKMVITSGPLIVPAVAGKCSFMDAFITGLLEDPRHPSQLGRFLDWLAHCRRAVLNHRRVQTPAVALAGQRGDGKSLLIEIINRSLGNRSAKGYDFFSGRKTFNAEMAGAELIVMDDDAASNHHGARVRLAQAIKSNQFASGVRIEGKGREAFNADPIQAIVMAANRDAEALRVLPELAEMDDKIMLLKTSPAPCHETPEENIAAIEAELPAFLHQLEARDLSQAYDERRRLKCFWHPEIVEAVGLLSPERQLLDLAHQLPAVHNTVITGGEWCGTAAELEAALTDREATTQHQARRLLSWGGACGTYLGRLADAGNLGVHRGRLTARTKIQTYRIGERPDDDPNGELPLEEKKVYSDEPY